MNDCGEGKHVIGRKTHRCEGCYGPIPNGESHYHFHGKYDGEWQNWRMHVECYSDYQQYDEPEFFPGDMPWPERIRALAEATS